MATSLSAIAAPHSGFSSSLFSSRQRLSAAWPSSSSSRTVRCGVAAEGIRDGGVLTAPSLYSLLGLDQDVGLADIKNAYRQMARKYHPDVCPLAKKEDCTKLFLQVQDAYETLSDPERRAEYDYYLMHPLSANAYGLANIAKNRKGTRQRDEGVSEAWKMQWQAQLSHLRMKSRMEQAQTKTSWGAQMRSRATQD